jgi:hypothetical protein
MMPFFFTYCHEVDTFSLFDVVTAQYFGTVLKSWPVLQWYTHISIKNSILMLVMYTHTERSIYKQIEIVFFDTSTGRFGMVLENCY